MLIIHVQLHQSFCQLSGVGQSTGGAATGRAVPCIAGARCLPQAVLAVTATCAWVLFCYKNNVWNPDSSHEYFKVKFNVSSTCNKNTTSNSTFCLYGTFFLKRLRAAIQLASRQPCKIGVIPPLQKGEGDEVCGSKPLAAGPRSTGMAMGPGSCWSWFLGERVGFCAGFWKSPMEAYSCTGLYPLSIIPFTSADPSAVLRDVRPRPAQGASTVFAVEGLWECSISPGGCGQEPLCSPGACTGSGQEDMGPAGRAGLARADLCHCFFPV